MLPRIGCANPRCNWLYWRVSSPRWRPRRGWTGDGRRTQSNSALDKGVGRVAECVSWTQCLGVVQAGTSGPDGRARRLARRRPPWAVAHCVLDTVGESWCRSLSADRVCLGGSRIRSAGAWVVGFAGMTGRGSKAHGRGLPIIASSCGTRCMSIKHIVSAGRPFEAVDLSLAIGGR